MSTKRKLPGKLGLPQVKASAKVLGKGTLDESRTVVTGGGNAVKPNINGAKEVVNISSDSSSEEEEEEGSDEDGESVEEASAEGDVAMEDAEAALQAPILEDDAEEAGEPSFGDLVRANASEPIDVAGAFEDEDRALTYPQGNQIQTPSGASLGTVLTQALRTNDVSLLESCLHTSDINTIRATIQRLDSPLAGTLLQKLAERLHRRPGRAGSLMVWVQWTLVTHGGYLATQPDLIKKLAQLNRVIDERAKGLQSLLSLKGKLDMLEAQIELRRSMQRRRVEDEEDDDGVIYVEGQESEEDIVEPKKTTANGDMDFSGSEESEDMPMANGMIADSADEDEESSDEDGILDDEAEETDADSGDEDEVDFDDQDSEGEDVESDDDAAAAPPSKMPKIGGMASRKR
jgi:U3 small nucleolar RNA-associated protein 5